MGTHSFIVACATIGLDRRLSVASSVEVWYNQCMGVDLPRPVIRCNNMAKCDVLARVMMDVELGDMVAFARAIKEVKLAAKEWQVIGENVEEGWTYMLITFGDATSMVIFTNQVGHKVWMQA